MNYVDVGQLGGCAFNHLTHSQQLQYRNQGYIASSNDCLVGFGNTARHFKRDEPICQYDPTPEPIRKKAKPFENDDWDKPLYEQAKMPVVKLSAYGKALSFDVEASSYAELVEFVAEHRNSSGVALQQKVEQARERILELNHKSERFREEVNRLTYVFGEGFTPTERATLRHLFISGLRFWEEQERRLKERRRRI